MKGTKKLIILSTITGGLLISATGAHAASFKDVKENYWADDEINYLFEEKIIGGNKNGMFQPNNPVTKSQVAIMLTKALNLKANNKSKVNVTDVSKSNSYYNAIAAAIQAGLFKNESKFNPSKPMTNEEIAQIFVKAFKLKGATDLDIKDVSKKSDSYNAISAVIENDIITLDKDGNFKPNHKVTRAEFAAYLSRALNSDFLPTQYNIPQNMNPIIVLFDLMLKNPEDIKTLFSLNNDYGLKELSKNIENVNVTEFKEIARLNGTAEFMVRVDVKLKGKEGLLVNGENVLYFLVSKEDYMDYKILSIDKKPHLQADDSISFTNNSALKLFANSNHAYWYVVSGGEGNGQIETFTKDGMEYRYLAESLNTEEKLKKYLGNTYTPEQVTKIFKDLGFIIHNGKLAQPNADGGSILNFEKATIKQTYSSTTAKKYELSVPLGDTGKVQKMVGELRFVEGQGWRVKSLNEVVVPEISDSEAVKIIADANNAYWTVVRGGDGTRKSGTFTHGNIEYRYMSKSLNTEEKLKNFLGKTYTPAKVDKIFKDLRFITYKGELAQPNADGGSILEYGKATIKLISDSGTVRKYELKVPLGGTKEVQKMKGELHYIEGKGWRVHSLN